MEAMQQEFVHLKAGVETVVEICESSPNARTHRD